VGGNLIYVEEASFISQDVFYKVILPLLEVASTALIMISTPEGEGNYYSQMLDMKDHLARPLFNTVKIGMVCAWCQSNNPTPSSCTHRETERPQWKSVTAARTVRAMYGSRTNLHQRESMGMVVTDGECAFPSAWIHRLLKGNRTPPPPTPEYIFVACDPNGGGSSDMAIMSVMRWDGHFVVSRTPRKSRRSSARR
jgi:hypothetical protein